MTPDPSRRRPRGGRLTPQRRKLLDQLLDQALEKPAELRAPFVARCLEKAPRLGFWLERLVMASAEPTGFIDHSARHMAADALAARSDIFPRTLVRGTRLGPWRIIARIGTGGMGEVYQAERADGAFDMTVAIKLIRSRKENLARLLESERQLMARLSHGSIARLIDGGLAEDDRPYLVMEWVDGRTLGEWAQGDDIPAERFLDVFTDACSALAFAHRSLVVHGDIKPANLAVCRDGQVKLLDFGVAKLLDADGSELTPSALTPGFAAPEQIGRGEVSTASDIYSLGALLYWMVYGKAPDRAQPRPGVRAVWRAYRRLPDLLAIADKAMDADPEQRYATVNALLLDLQRLRELRPVMARPASIAERSRLWVQRHKLATGLGTVAGLAVAIGISTVLWQARIVAYERDVARHEAALSLAVKDQLIVMFREAGSLHPDRDRMTARELLDETVEVSSRLLRDDPLARAEVQLAIAELLISMGDYSRADPLLQSIVAEVDERYSAALRAKLYRNMAMVMHRRGDLSRGLLMADQAVNMIERFSGDHRDRLSDALQMRARLRREQGDWEGAVRDLQRARLLALSLGDGALPVRARAEGNLAATYLARGQYEAAVRHMEVADELWNELGRAESPDALVNLYNLAMVLDRMGRIDEAEQRLRANIATRERRLGPSGALAAAKLQLGRLLTVRGVFVEAEGLMQEASAMMTRFVGEHTPDYASTLFGLGELARARGDHEAALRHFAAAETVFRDLAGNRHVHTLMAQTEQLAVLAESGRFEDSQSFDALLELIEETGAAGRALRAQLHCERARWQLGQGRVSLARSDAELCFGLRESLGQGGWRLLEARAIAELADARSGDAGAAERLASLLGDLSLAMSPDHARLRWLLVHSEEVQTDA